MVVADSAVAEDTTGVVVVSAVVADFTVEVLLEEVSTAEVMAAEVTFEEATIADPLVEAVTVDHLVVDFTLVGIVQDQVFIVAGDGIALGDQTGGSEDSTFRATLAIQPFPTTTTNASPLIDT